MPTPDVPADHDRLAVEWQDAGRPDTTTVSTHDGTTVITLPPPDLETALTGLAAAAEQVNVAARPSTLPPWEDALARLADLRDTIDTLRKLDALLTQHIYLTGEHGKRVLDGIGEVWVTRGRSKERWDHRGVARAVVDAKMEERGGEVPGDPWEVAEWLLDVLGIGYVRKTALDGLGIPRDPFYDSEPGTIQVTLPSGT